MIVLDTSFVVAWHSARDSHHSTARALADPLRREEWGRALLPEYVFLEVSTVLAARRSLAAAVAVGDLLLRSRELDFVSSSELFDDTMSVFRAQGQQGLSFVDAAIVATARRFGAGFVATFDQGFRGVDGLTVVPAAR